jgi:hypothetical protein
MSYEVKTKTMDAWSIENEAKVIGKILGTTPTSSDNKYYEIPLGNGLYLGQWNSYGSLIYSIYKKDGSNNTSPSGFRSFVINNYDDQTNKTNLKYIKTNDLFAVGCDGYSGDTGSHYDGQNTYSFFMCTLTGGIVYFTTGNNGYLYDPKNNAFALFTPLYVVNNPTDSGVGCVRFFACGTTISNPFLTHDDLFVYNDDGTIVKSYVPFTIDGGTYIPVMTATTNNAMKLLLKQS